MNKYRSNKSVGICSIKVCSLLLRILLESFISIILFRNILKACGTMTNIYQEITSMTWLQSFVEGLLEGLILQDAFRRQSKNLTPLQ